MKQTPQKVKLRQKGFSLIEVVISIFIIGVVLVIYSVSSNSVVLNRNSKRQELALRIATSKIEELRNTAYASLPSTGSFANSLLSNLPNGQASITVSSYNATTKQVIVTVTWSEPNNPNTRQVELTTLINQGGL
jgi:prepilin-type N-terminal cleavage/methylation domain-containing protein